MRHGQSGLHQPSVRTGVGRRALMQRWGGGYNQNVFNRMWLRRGSSNHGLTFTRMFSFTGASLTRPHGFQFLCQNLCFVVAGKSVWTRGKESTHLCFAARTSYYYEFTISRSRYPAILTENNLLAGVQKMSLISIMVRLFIGLLLKS